MNKKFPLYVLIAAFVSILFSCNAKSDPKEEPSYSTVAITSFKLQKDDSVLVNLDSVFFSIDLDRHEIYNADSLPMGTDVSKIVPVIGYPACKSLEIHVTDGKIMKDTVVDYLKSAKDSIDFTGDVKLTIVSHDGTNTATYSLKVNVHKMKSDSLYWNQTARRDLPAITNAVAQKSVKFNDKAYCLMQETHQYTLAVTADPAKGGWEKSVLDLSFVPNIRSFSASDDALYILDESGSLYSSTDGINWNACDVKMYSLIGGYENMVLGVKQEGANYYYTAYPLPSGFAEIVVDEQFPITGSTTPFTISRQWMENAECLILGGITANGTEVGDVWGYDGEKWGKVSTNGLPVRHGAIMFPYFTSDVDKKFNVTTYTTLIAIGGISNGEATKTVYVSRDMGVNWKVADVSLQLPDYMPGFGYADVMLFNTSMTRSGEIMADGWEIYPSRKLPAWNFVVPNYINTRSAYVITWDCPYIYLFGGVSNDGSLQNNIWKGVINRLSFKPII